MKLHFDPNQRYQIEAINSVVDIFEGQPLNKSDFEFSLKPAAGGLFFGENGVGNNLILSEKQILENIRAVQERNGIKPSDKLDGMNFSVEMETGTGKTYVYLRTIYELNKNYGFKKFIIVVPSVAIREGALKNLEITEEHFRALYGKTPANYEVYDAAKVSGIRNFALSNSVQILVINIDSFAKDINIMNRPNDKLSGRKPVEFLQSVRPVVIVDEPQNMETQIRKAAIANLNPCCTLRYSATHTNLYNLVYSLNPVSAYDMGLVKQIEVDSVLTENDFNRAFVQLEGVSSTKTRTSAKIRIDINGKKGVERKVLTAKVGDDLYELSNKRENYKTGYIVNEIDVSNQCITFSSGDMLRVGDSRGGLRDEVMKEQMRKTVEEHFQKERKYKEKGIKVLSLFFIDRVANYRAYDDAGNSQKGKFALWFEEIYKALAEKEAFKGVIPFDAGKVHNGYFAQDKKGVFRDSSENRETQADDNAYHLIMKDKEKLLDPANSLRFIFSHSALREGWDNPNVFQICTLNETRSELKKRQEIGRGLRLCVNQNGDRVLDKNVNILTVVANESYDDFASKLQKEIQDDCGVAFTGRLKDKRDRKKVSLRKGYEVSEGFIELWNKIKHKTTYNVEYETAELIKRASAAINKMPAVRVPIIKSVKTHLEMLREGVGGKQVGISIREAYDTSIEVPDILGYIQGKTDLTRSTILDILKKSGRLGDALKNPQLFLDMAVAEIKNILNEMMVDGIKYEKIGGQEYSMMLFKDIEIESYIGNLYKVKNEDKTIADHIEISSMSGIEKKFAEDCENTENVEFFFKLPRGFKIKTPLGDYTPDWALIFKNEKRLYFVAETKGSLDKIDLRAGENLKIKCGAAHFKELPGVTFKPATKLEELM